jgi:hypothetical protein
MLCVLRCCAPSPALQWASVYKAEYIARRADLSSNKAMADAVSGMFNGEGRGGRGGKEGGREGGKEGGREGGNAEWRGERGPRANKT